MHIFITGLSGLHYIQVIEKLDDNDDDDVCLIYEKMFDS